MHVYGVLSAVGRTEGGIVIARKGNSRRAEMIDIRDPLILCEFIYGTVVDGMHRLYRAELFVEFNVDSCHIFYLHKCLIHYTIIPRLCQ
jgi:hypothetical protein